jgi:hypothetical protein
VSSAKVNLNQRLARASFHGRDTPIPSPQLDDKEGAIETKSRAGTRTVPIAAILPGHRLAHGTKSSFAGIS